MLAIEQYCPSRIAVVHVVCFVNAKVFFGRRPRRNKALLGPSILSDFGRGTGKYCIPALLLEMHIITHFGGLFQNVVFKSLLNFCVK